MLFMPFQILGLWLRALLAVAFLGLAAFLLRYWYDHRYIEVRSEVPAHAVVCPQDRGAEAVIIVRRVPRKVGPDRETAALVCGLVLLGLSLGGTYPAWGGRRSPRTSILASKRWREISPPWWIWRAGAL